MNTPGKRFYSVQSAGRQWEATDTFACSAARSWALMPDDGRGSPLLPCPPRPDLSALQTCLLCFFLSLSRKGKMNGQAGLIFKLEQEP